MENKYYTPEIEEFHVGFEYQVQERTLNRANVPCGWIAETFKDGQSAEYLVGLHEDIRIKLLDLDDIMLCGWMINECGITINSGVSSYTMVFIEDESIVGIFDMALNQVVYNGTIKNISELRFIMKRLGIEINLPSYQAVNSTEEK